MRITHSIEETRQAIAAARSHANVVGLVATMGFLHDGHLSLIGVARDAGATFIAVSIFVNPLQFAPGEDFERYPRDEKRDIELLEQAGVDLLFLPPVEAIYPPHSATRVTLGGVAMPLEGERRPGHFDGVATVVTKLFNIVQPDVAAFGRKDAQQCAVIERMVRDLDIPVSIVFGETVREADGLARSSRNSYLTAEEREKAPLLHRALRAGENAILHGVLQTEAVEKLMNRVIAEGGGVEVDYLVVIDPETFAAPAGFDRDLLLAGAVRVGKTRLIDNVRIARRDIPHTHVERS